MVFRILLEANCPDDDIDFDYRGGRGGGNNNDTSGGGGGGGASLDDASHLLAEWDGRCYTLTLVRRAVPRMTVPLFRFEYSADGDEFTAVQSFGRLVAPRAFKCGTGQTHGQHTSTSSRNRSHSRSRSRRDGSGRSRGRDGSGGGVSRDGKDSQKDDALSSKGKGRPSNAGTTATAAFATGSGGGRVSGEGGAPPPPPRKYASRSAASPARVRSTHVNGHERQVSESCDTIFFENV
jgi:hypothetical protein